MEKCIFCEIVAKRIPASVIYEDADFLAFLDINPLNPGHTLLIPKQHARWTYDVEKFGEYWEVAKAAALASISSLKAQTVNFMTMGFSVQHAHIHIVPRFENDGHEEIPDRRAFKQIPKEEMASIASKMSEAIKNNPPRKPATVIQEIKKEDKPQEPTASENILSEDDIMHIRREVESG